MVRLIRGSVALATAISVAGILAPAQATAQAAGVTVEITKERCGATITYRNQTASHFWGDYRSDERAGTPDQDLPDLPSDPAEYQDAHDHGVAPEASIGSGPLAGSPWGLQYQPVHLSPGTTVTIEVQVGEVRRVAAGVRRGADPSGFVDWIEAPEVQPCSDPQVDFEDICEGSLVRITNREAAAAPAQFSFDPQMEGVEVIVVLDPGRSPEPLFYGREAGEIAVEDLTTGAMFTHRWTAPASEDCQPLTGSGGWSTADDPASGAGGSLPLTGSPAARFVVGALTLLLLGGGLFLVARRRRVTFTA